MWRRLGEEGDSRSKYGRPGEKVRRGAVGRLTLGGIRRKSGREPEGFT